MNTKLLLSVIYKKKIQQPAKQPAHEQQRGRLIGGVALLYIYIDIYLYTYTISIYIYPHSHLFIAWGITLAIKANRIYIREAGLELELELHDDLSKSSSRALRD